MNAKTDKWFTPPYIIEMVKEVLGEIDLDPASEPIANETVKANRYITDRALEGEWVSNAVFLNPPGGKINNKSKPALFWKKLVEEYQKGNVEEAIFLSFSADLVAVSQKYGGPSLLDYTVCFLKDRIKFRCPINKTAKAPRVTSVIVYLGPNVDKFKQVFSKLGACK